MRKRRKSKRKRTKTKGRAIRRADLREMMTKTRRMRNSRCKAARRVALMEAALRKVLMMA